MIETKNSQNEQITKLIAEARELAGTVSNSPKISYINVVNNSKDGDPGTFTLKTWNKEKGAYEKQTLGKSFEGVVLAVTRQCTQWDYELRKNVCETNEFINYDEPITLIKDGELVRTCGYTEMKRYHHLLKQQRILYILVNNLIVKLYLRSSSMIDFSKYEKLIVEEGSALQAWTTEFSLRSERGDKGPYYIVEFTKDEVTELSKMVDLSKKVRKGIDALHQRFLERYVHRGDSKLEDVSEAHTSPTEQDEEMQDAVMPELPF